jgi:hypothetical protein
MSLNEGGGGRKTQKRLTERGAPLGFWRVLLVNLAAKMDFSVLNLPGKVGTTVRTYVLKQKRLTTSHSDLFRLQKRLTGVSATPTLIQAALK